MKKENQVERTIFLDVDGVLNNYRTRERSRNGYIGIDPQRVKVLRQIQEQTGASIVLSSTWREMWEPEYENCLADGKYLTDCLAMEGITVADKIPGYSGSNRGEEIYLYAKDHKCRSFIVLDDNHYPDFTANGIREKGSKANWIHTEFYSTDGGLRPEHVEKAIRLFRQQETR